MVGDRVAGLGPVLVLSPIFFYWLNHVSSERYEWLINGPGPFDQFGSGPYQLFNLGLFPLLLGPGLLAVGRQLRRRRSS